MRQIALDALAFADKDEAFYTYAAEHRLTVNEVAYYLNAYEYGGEAGLEAIRNPNIIPREVARQAIKTVARLLDERMSELALAYLMGLNLNRLGKDYKPEKAELSHAAVCRWLIKASSEPPAKEETR